MSNIFLNKNIGVLETSIRFILGAVILSITMLNSFSAAWIGLLAVYPVITAIMSWDPLYAAINSLISTVKKSSQEKPSILPVG